MSEGDNTHTSIRSGAAGTPQPSARLGPGTVLKNTYRIDAELGSGGMGTVFEATHLGLEKRMAVKVLSPRAVASPESLARFEREAKVAGKVSHPAMTHVIDFGVEQGTPYIVMEYVAGVELAQLIGRQGALAPRQAVAVMRQVVSLLRAAHALGIVHRDLKPSNIKVIEEAPDNGQLFVKVLDFGIAKVVGDIAGQLTSEGMMVGTPAYMAPEQISGKPIDGRTDLYAAGLIFHEMLSGVRAYQGETIARILHAQMTEPPPPIELPLPEVVHQTLRKFYEKRPEERFQDAAEADRALVACEEALRSFTASPATGAVQHQARPVQPQGTPSEVLSATMQRPEQAVASGGLSATMQRPEQAVLQGTPSPVTPAPAPAPATAEPRPAPAIVTDRQPAPPMVVNPPAAPMQPGVHGRPMPARPGLPGPARGPAQPARSSGAGKGCLIAVLVMGGMGALVMIASVLWFVQSDAFKEAMAESSMGHDYQPGGHQHPPEANDYGPGYDDPQDPDSAPAAHLMGEVLGEEAMADGLLRPGCYVTVVTFGSTRDETGHYEPWEPLEVSARAPIPCDGVRAQKPSAELRELIEAWPAEEKILQMQLLSEVPQTPGDPDTRRKMVRVHTRVSEP